MDFGELEDVTVWDFEDYEDASECINCGRAPILSIKLAKEYDDYE